MSSILRQLAAAAKGRMFAPESFSGSDFGYRIGRVIFGISDGLKASRRRVRRWLRSPALARRMAHFRRSVARRDWSAAREQAREIARLAEAARDVRLMEELRIALLRLGDYGLAGKLRLESRRVARGADPKEWERMFPARCLSILSSMKRRAWVGRLSADISSRRLQNTRSGVSCSSSRGS